MLKMGVVLFGANTFDHHKDLNNPRFANSIREFRKAISDNKITRGREVDILDIYNKPLLPSDVHTKITDFIRNDYDDFIIYYCGHGDVGRRDGDYRVFLRPSNRYLRNGTMLHVAGLIRDVQVMIERRRAYFVLDACYSGSAISEMESMDAGGAEALIDRNLAEAIEGANGTAILAASGKLAVATAKQEDKLTLFTGAFVRCLRDGISHKNELSTLSWLDIKDEIIRTTRDRLGPEAPVPKLTSFGDSAVDITRMPFFDNPAYVPRKAQWEGAEWAGSPWQVDERTSEHFYWKVITEDSPSSVIEDFLTRFPGGIFALPARGLLAKRIAGFNEREINRYLRDHPETKVRTEITSRLEVLGWESVQTSNEIAVLEQFIAAFLESDFAEEARSRIEVISREHADARTREHIETSASAEELEQLLRQHPDGPLSKLVAGKLAALKWQAIQSSTEIAELEHFIAAFPESDAADEARIRLDFVRRDLAEAEAWMLVKTSTVKKDLEQFVRDYPAGRFSGLATARLDELSAPPTAHERHWISRFNSPRVVIAIVLLVLGAIAGGAFRSHYVASLQVALEDLEAAGKDVTKLRDFVSRCEATSYCTLGREAGNRLVAARRSTEFLEANAALDAAGSDVADLSSFVARCRRESCPVLLDANKRLAAAEAERSRKEAASRELAAEIARAEDRKALDAAKGNLVQLRGFVQQCNTNSCTVAPEARDLLVKAEAVETARLARIAEDRKALDAAKGNLVQLRAFVQQCNANSCTVAPEARDLLAKAEAVEAARLARMAEDRKALDAAKGNLAQLRSFVQQCNANACTVAPEARDLLAKAEAVETARLARITEDRKALDAAKGNLAQLRSFVQQCNANACTVAPEARDLLAKVEAVETARLARIAEDQKALDAAKGNLGQLRSFVQQCNANSCTVAPEARDLLAKAEVVETARLARITEQARPASGFNTSVGYDMNGGDINSPDFLTRHTDAATCRAKCQATVGCIAYSFDKWIKTCYLKDKLVSLTLDPRSDTSIRKDQLFPGFLNGPKRFCRYPSLAVIGDGPPGFSSPTAKACEQSCEAEPTTCAAYLFRATDKQCRLLGNTVDRRKGIGNESFTSGVRTQLPCT